MVDQATPNLPSRDFDTTAAFYGQFGFAVRYRAGDWMILERGALLLEFFPFADLDPATSSFGACLRLDDIDSFEAALAAAAVPQQHIGWPRWQAARREPWGGRVGYLVDPDGTLMRLVDNASLSDAG